MKENGEMSKIGHFNSEQGLKIEFKLLYKEELAITIIIMLSSQLELSDIDITKFSLKKKKNTRFIGRYYFRIYLL